MLQNIMMQHPCLHPIFLFIYDHISIDHPSVHLLLLLISQFLRIETLNWILTNILVGESSLNCVPFHILRVFQGCLGASNQVTRLPSTNQDMLMLPD